MAEFTGERVIPGLVDENLLNEHLARYRFAARFAGDVHVLDAGCGSGYGTAEFGAAASITAADISTEAIRYAQQHFGRPGVRFLQASCTALPFAAASFDLVTAFEVIEHLEQWQQLLEEANRVLRDTGVLLVSTPNKSYYAETRGSAGPNPFHCHEFEFAEFEAALYAVFPHVRMWTQNRSETMMFAPSAPDGAALDARGDAAPETAHFFVGACSRSAILQNDVFAWAPSTGNLLREREHHIARLDEEREKKDAWLKEMAAGHSSLQAIHEQTVAELRHSNEWAAGLNQELADSRAVIRQLQSEAAVRLAWACDLEADIERGNTEIRRLNQAAAELEKELADRTVWARGLEAELAERTAAMQAQLSRQAQEIAKLRHERELVARSRWMRMGRLAGLGPQLADSTAGEE